MTNAVFPNAAKLGFDGRLELAPIEALEARQRPSGILAVDSQGFLAGRPVNVVG